MSYQIKCDKCGHVLMEGTGESQCFMSAGCKMGCRKCGNQLTLTEDMLLSSTKEEPKKKGIRFEV